MNNVKITIKERTGVFDAPVSVLDALYQLVPDDAPLALGCFCGGQAFELTQIIGEDCTLYPITFANEEGRRIYERSLRFVMLMAMRRVFPGERVRIEHSVGYGVYLRLLEKTLNNEDVQKIEKEMRCIVEADLPFNRMTWSREKAIEYFQREGEIDKVRLLAYRPYDHFNVYTCGDMAEYFYGAMLPSTGYIKAFKLRPVSHGLVMQMPSPQNPLIPAQYVSRPKHLAAFEQSNTWCSILDCTNAADLNDFTVSGNLRPFIRVNEALHDKSIAEIAEGIKTKGARAVFVAGPSSSGKTTFSNRLCIHLKVLGIDTALISLDDFYRNRDELPLEADGRPDLEALTALDVPLLNRCLHGLLNGEEVLMPRFNFHTSRRCEEMYPLRLKEHQIILFEGIHGLNPALHTGFDPQDLCRVYISELTCLNLDNHNRIRTTDARLLRRIVRDHQFRNTPPEETLTMWNSVRRGEETWIFPYQEQADFVFNSVLHYELPILKNYAYDLLMKIKPEHPTYLASRRLLKILHYILPAPADVLKEIPPLSLLREFIGGCTLYN